MKQRRPEGHAAPTMVQLFLMPSTQLTPPCGPVLSLLRVSRKLIHGSGRERDGDLWVINSKPHLKKKLHVKAMHGVRCVFSKSQVTEDKWCSSFSVRKW